MNALSPDSPDFWLRSQNAATHSGAFSQNRAREPRGPLEWRTRSINSPFAIWRSSPKQTLYAGGFFISLRKVKMTGPWQLSGREPRNAFDLLRGFGGSCEGGPTLISIVLRAGTALFAPRQIPSSFHPCKHSNSAGSCEMRICSGLDSESGGDMSGPRKSIRHWHLPVLRGCLRSRTLSALIARCPVLVMNCWLAMLTGCAYNEFVPTSTNSLFFIALSSTNPVHAAQSRIIDTNCATCNSTDRWGKPVQHLMAAFPRGGAQPVVWSVWGGDPVAGPGTITQDGQYTPPSYLTQDRVLVVVRASLRSKPTVQDTAIIWVTPGFVQPLTPENAATGANGTVVITGYLAQVGGNADISYSIEGSAADGSTNSGWLSDSTCKREENIFTSCSVTYHAPSIVIGDRVVNVAAAVGSADNGITTRILLNAAGISSNPANHQTQMSPILQLGGSGGNDSDYDSIRGRVVDCCGGTLGGLVKGSDDKEYVLSNNHVLARSDHAVVGDAIVQPGLIDRNCAPGSQDTGPAPHRGTDRMARAWLQLDQR